MDVTTWGEFYLIFSFKLIPLAKMAFTVAVLAIVLMTVTRCRTTSTTSAAGTTTSAAPPASPRRAAPKAETKDKKDKKDKVRATEKDHSTSSTTVPRRNASPVMVPSSWDSGYPSSGDGYTSADDDAPAAASTATVKQLLHKKRPTGHTTVDVLAECIRRGHDLHPGRNSHTIFMTCRTCQHHVTWDRGDKFDRRTLPQSAAVNQLSIYWDRLLGNNPMKTLWERLTD